MKHFRSSKLQLVTYDEDEKMQAMTIGDVVEDADVEEIKAVAEGLDPLTKGRFDHVKVVESYHIPL